VAQRTELEGLLGRLAEVTDSQLVYLPWWAKELLVDVQRHLQALRAEEQSVLGPTIERMLLRAHTEIDELTQRLDAVTAERDVLRQQLGRQAAVTPLRRAAN